jgi:hypothetical protein
MPFSITFSDPPDSIVLDADMFSYGRLNLGEYSESFVASLSLWSKSDYEAHWHRSIKDILSGQTRRMLVTSIDRPETAEAYFYWPMWRVNDEVIFQERFVLPSDLEEEFDPVTPPISLIGEYEITSFSEWRLPIADLETFVSMI